MTTTETPGESDAEVYAEMEARAAINFAQFKTDFPAGYVDALPADQIADVFAAGFTAGAAWCANKMEGTES